MELNDDVYEQIKDFNRGKLTKEQKLLIDNLILDEELKERYKICGLCKECKQPNTYRRWCQSCNAKRFQQNFKSWTSGNHDVDKFIQETQLNAKKSWEKLEWIEYERFENIEYISKGGFGTIYKANWKDGQIYDWNYETNQWNKSGNMIVALKCLNDSKDVTLEFLHEINSHLKMSSSNYIVKCYGITKEPKTDNFMMVMQYAENGSLRQLLNKDFNSMNWYYKFKILKDIAEGLDNIHKKGLIHRDFHCGNILNFSSVYSSITDLGLCKPANEKFDNNNIYGVLPYAAPELLRGKEYSQASDIYSFGIVAYEVCTGSPPYHDVAHDELLAIRICQGLRLKSNYKIPPLILNVIEQCWDVNPLKRPNSEQLWRIFEECHDRSRHEDSEIYKQINEADKFNEKQINNLLSVNNDLTYIMHHQAFYASRLLNFKTLPEPNNEKYTDDNFNYSESTKLDFTKLYQS